jgi:AcrR family transcriptional regulator
MGEFAEHMLCNLPRRGHVAQRVFCYLLEVPRVVDPAQRREEVVQAAWTVIADEGLEAATVRRIAEVAGCTTGRVTHWFSDKDEVLVAALRRVNDAAAARMTVAVEREDPEDALRAVLVEALPLDDERRREWRVWLAFWGATLAEPALQEENERRYAEWRAALTKLVRAARRRGHLDVSVDVAPTVDGLVALVDGLGMQATMAVTTLPAKATLATLDGHLHLLAARG